MTKINFTVIEQSEIPIRNSLETFGISSNVFISNISIQYLYNLLRLALIATRIK